MLGVTGSGTLGLNLVNDGSITDLADNSLTGPEVVTGGSVQVLPSINGISDLDPMIATGLTSVQFGVTFNENVFNVGTSDFILSGSGSSGTISSVTGSGSSYAVTVTGVSGTGDLGLQLSSYATGITDQYGTALAGAGPNFTSQDYILSNTLYWDGNGLTSLGGSGRWNSYDWRVGSSTGPLHAWLDGADAVFSGASGTVNLTSNVTVGSITFNNNTTVDLAGQNIAFTAIGGSGSDGTITNNGSNVSTISFDGLDGFFNREYFAGIIEDGAGQVALNVASGSLFLQNFDTYTGGTTVASGRETSQSAGRARAGSKGTSPTTGSFISQRPRRLTLRVKSAVRAQCCIMAAARSRSAAIIAALMVTLF